MTNFTAQDVANARFKVSCNLKAIRREDGSVEDHPEHGGVREIGITDAILMFGNKPGFEEWLANALEEKAKREESGGEGA